jgi:hypothetical protein
MNSIVLSRDFNIKNVQFDDKMRSLDTGSKMKYISYLKNPLIIQTPECYLPYGINNSTMDDENSNKYTMDISFRDMDNRPGLQRFFNIMKEMDTLIVSEAFKNQKEWLRKSYPNKDVVEALYSPIIKYAKDKDSGEITDAYPPTFKMKIPFNNDKFTCEFFDNESNPLKSEYILATNMKGAKAVTLVKCNGIWFAGGKFGCSWKAIQVQITPKLNSIGCAIRRCDDDIMDDNNTSQKNSDEDSEVESDDE